MTDPRAEKPVKQVSCPRCYVPVPPEAEHCPNCNFPDPIPEGRVISVPLANAIVVPRTTLLHQMELRRLALLFDQLLTFPQHEGDDLPMDRITTLQRTARELAERQLLVRVGLDLMGDAAPFFVTVNGKPINGRDALLLDTDLVVKFPESLRYLAPAHLKERPEHRMVRLASTMTWDDAPLVAQLPQQFGDQSGPLATVRVTLNQIPFPSADVPWDEIVAFRKLPETRASYRDLRRWMQRSADQGLRAADLADELRDALERNRQHVLGAGISHSALSLGAIVTLGAIGIAGGLAGDVREGLGSIGALGLEFARQHFTPAPSQSPLPRQELAYLSAVQRRFGDD